MTIGYIITAHTLPDHLARLVDRLRSDRARFFIHVDKRAPREVMDEVQRQLGAAPDVHLLPRHPCHWASFSQVEATMEGVRAILATDDISYGVLLTGQDYPLSPPPVIEATLDDAGGRSFMTHWPSTGRFLDRVQLWHWHGTVRGRRVHVPNRFLPLRIKRPVPGGLRPFTGTAYWCLSRECLRYVDDEVRRRQGMVRGFRRCSHPDESFFQTVLMNSPLADGITNDDLRYIDWSDGLSSPRLLTMNDLERLLESPQLFARKFDPHVDARVLDELDRSIDAQSAALRGAPKR